MKGMKSNQITVGTRVAYAREFLRSTGQYTGWAPFARGVVIKSAKIHDVVLIKWDTKNSSGESGPAQSHVNVHNLVREDRIHLEPI
jgi:hypothetical protein